jgi:hypothetical protein
MPRMRGPVYPGTAMKRKYRVTWWDQDGNEVASAVTIAEEQRDERHPERTMFMTEGEFPPNIQDLLNKHPNLQRTWEPVETGSAWKTG